MNRKSLWAILLTLLCVYCVLVLAACDGGEEPAHTHVFAEWQQTLAPTCDAVGEETRTCTCGESETQEVEKLAHSYGEWRVTTVPTCGVKGVECRACACGATDTRAIAATGAHSFTARSTTAAYVHTAPTCQQPGVYYYKCVNCTAKGTQTFVGDSLATHSFTSQTQTAAYFKSAANCESPALYYYKCQYCDAKGQSSYTVGGEVHDFTAKSMTEEYVHTAATCQSAGIYYYKCVNCTDKGTQLYAGEGLGKHNYAGRYCTTCGTKQLYVHTDEYIYFGEYPQTLKATHVTITSKTDDRGYYLGNDGAYYAKVTATPYRDGYVYSTGVSVTGGTDYYFKVQPIRWRILSEDDGTALILCDSVIASSRYDGNDNNYAESEIRAFLNAEFYNTAFSELERELILATTVDNSVASTGYANNDCACENTTDKIFLASWAEMTSESFGFSTDEQAHDTARMMLASDYSIATGAWISTSLSFYGNGHWWLRSPYYNDSGFARLVLQIGFIHDSEMIDNAGGGVVPALQIRLVE